MSGGAGGRRLNSLVGRGILSCVRMYVMALSIGIKGAPLWLFRFDLSNIVVIGIGLGDTKSSCPVGVLGGPASGCCFVGVGRRIACV